MKIPDDSSQNVPQKKAFTYSEQQENPTEIENKKKTK